MKMSWSKRLFLLVNRRVGAYPWLDRIMVFCAHWLIYILLLALLLWSSHVFGVATSLHFGIFLLFTGSSLVIAYSASYMIALLWPHERPLREIPTIKELIRPVNAWKSFPSDHTITVTVFAMSASLFDAPIWLRAVLWVGVVVVGCSRVYVGVHYPRDIIGGFFLALLSTLGIVHIFL
ncbi:MAG TPA: phosphatase PAP2 family protein [Candidatus Kapabacteria bacterium]|nr:phosphatase PAP2 family protein [Candidatus Kapabacteria bacterium]